MCDRVLVRVAGEWRPASRSHGQIHRGPAFCNRSSQMRAASAHGRLESLLPFLQDSPRPFQEPRPLQDTSPRPQKRFSLQAVAPNSQGLHVATFFDWSDVLRSCVNVNHTDTTITNNETTPKTKKQTNDRTSTNSPAMLTGRLFVREKTTLTKGEREIITGICQNRGSKGNNSQSSLNLDLRKNENSMVRGTEYVELSRPVVRSARPRTTPVKPRLEMTVMPALSAPPSTARAGVEYSPCTPRTSIEYSPRFNVHGYNPAMNTLLNANRTNGYTTNINGTSGYNTTTTTGNGVVNSHSVNNRGVKSGYCNTVTEDPGDVHAEYRSIGSKGCGRYTVNVSLPHVEAQRPPAPPSSPVQEWWGLEPNFRDSWLEEDTDP